MPYFTKLYYQAFLLAIVIASQVNALAQSPLEIGTKRYSSGAPNGVLEPWRVCNVAFAESGIIASIDTQAGRTVRTGDRLASLDSSAIEIQLQAAIAQAHATGRLRTAEAEVDLNERKVKAFQDARQQHASSRMELERALADLKVAQGRLQTELDERDMLAWQVKRLQEQLSQRTVTAPMDGVVVQLHKQIGEFIAPTSPEVLRIVDVSRLRASFFLRLAEAEALTSKETVRVWLNDNLTVDGTIEMISPVADGESGLLEVRVLIENSEGKILAAQCKLLLNDS